MGPQPGAVDEPDVARGEAIHHLRVDARGALEEQPRPLVIKVEEQADARGTQHPGGAHGHGDDQGQHQDVCPGGRRRTAAPRHVGRRRALVIKGRHDHAPRRKGANHAEENGREARAAPHHRPHLDHDLAHVRRRLLIVVIRGLGVPRGQAERELFLGAIPLALAHHLLGLAGSLSFPAKVHLHPAQRKAAYDQDEAEDGPGKEETKRPVRSSRPPGAGGRSGVVLHKLLTCFSPANRSPTNAARMKCDCDRSRECNGRMPTPTQNMPHAARHAASSATTTPFPTGQIIPACG